MNVAIRNLTGGELAPSHYARTDLAKYQTGLRTLRNFLIRRSGGVSNRSGTGYIAEKKDMANPGRLIDWVRDDATVYVLEFGSNTLRFFDPDGPVTVSGVVAWVTATAYTVGDLRSNGGVNYYCILAHTSGALTEPGVGADWEDNWYALTGDIYEIPTPFGFGSLPDLQYVQRADDMRFSHRSFQPRVLTRESHTRWILTTVTIGSSMPSVTGIVISLGTAGITNHWAITAIDKETGEESVADDTIAGQPGTNSALLVPSAGTPVRLQWTIVPNAKEYRIYRKNLIGSANIPPFALIGVSETNSFEDVGTVGNSAIRPPKLRDPFESPNFPKVVGRYQQRTLYANTSAKPETVYSSRIGSPANFNLSNPSVDSDPVTFNPEGRKVNEIRHLLDFGALLVFTSQDGYVIEGDEAGSLTPTGINPRARWFHGIDEELRPLVVDDIPIYVQARGSIVRSVFKDAIDGYAGDDLTIFSAHLFKRHTIVDWAYQETPHSIVWCVRDDGVLLSLTFIRAHAIWGWARHDTDGTVENVCVVPEGNEDAVYLIVKRTIDGAEVRYIERFTTREIDEDDPTDGVFMDCALAYDGVATSTITGLDHLEGKAVSVLADGNVVASPNNDEYDEIVVTAGQITLPAAASLVHVGLPYLSDLETLDIDTPSGRSLKEGKMLVSKVGLYVEASRGMLAGTEGAPEDNDANTDDSPTFGLMEFEGRESEPLEDPSEPVTDYVEIPTESDWSHHGRVFIRQVDPVPLSILSITPIGAA